ncbi:MAG: filamentous hemagglutinin N-terminal domain-containing protein [Thermosynechococcaceae cyanobacterium]
MFCRKWDAPIGLGGSVLFLFQLCAFPVNAQVVPDNTLSTMVEGDRSAIEVTGGAQRGSNLFHSFESFSALTDQKINFQVPSNGSIENIFSRVTGRSISRIDGILQAKGSANLFLINPNGIVFGPNATLEIGGSFLGGTASGVVFADGVIFSAVSSQVSPLLTMSGPVGIQFASAPGSITNQSNATPNGETDLFDAPVGLQVKSGNALVLVGGEVNIEGGHLSAASGRIELGSVGDNSFVGLDHLDNSSNQGWSLNYDQVYSFQDIHLGLEPTIVPSLSGIDTSSINTSGAGGTVTLRGRNVSLKNSSQIFNVTTGAEDGGIIKIIAAESVVIDGVGSALLSQVGIEPDAEVAGRGGDIRIETKNFFIRNGGAVSSATGNPGNAGNLLINASERVEVTGTGALATPFGLLPFPSRLTTATASIEDAGDGGTVTINTQQFVIGDGAFVDVDSFGLGTAGMINITTNALTLDQGNINAATVSSDGGNLNLQVSDLLLLRNGSQITAAAGGTGTGGNIDINAGVLFAVPNQDSNIVANAFMGNGGNITIATQGIFGLEERPAILGNGTNDIDASSEFGVAGGVEVNTLVPDPDSGLVNLPESISDASQKLAVGCAAQQGNRFVFTGRGGTPPNPQELVSNPQPWKDLRDLSAFRTPQQRSESSKGYVKKAPVAQSSLVEATGWQRDDQGHITLVNLQPSLYAVGHAAHTC